MNLRGIVSLVGILGVLLPWQASAQSTTSGTIAGVVRDVTGGVLPGVTVEASSPALIEKVRSAVTDEQGRYRVVDLRPGLYTVTFTLPGFSTFKREGLELTTGFTVLANAEMRVGGLEETVTVTGASPMVDVQNIRTQNVMSREVLDTLPSGKSTQAYAALTVGARGAAQDVGGNTGETSTGFGVHGSQSGEGKHLMDGMPMAAPLFGGGLALRLNFVNQMAIQEVAVTYRGASAETENGGPQLNYVPKDGGNRFTMSAALTGATTSMQSDTLTDELRSRGLLIAPSIKRLFDLGGGAGGPIMQDRIWNYTSARWWEAQTYAPGQYFADKKTPAARGGLIYVPDLNRPAYTDIPNKDVTTRFTIQASQRNKLTISENIQRNCNCYQGVSLTLAPEATIMIFYESSLTQVTWSHPRTNRLLLEGGFTGLYQTQHPSRPPGVSTTDVAVVNNLTGLSYNARASSVGTSLGLAGDTLAYVNDVQFHQANGRASMSYVTGTHAFKTGFTLQQAWQGAFYKFNDPPVRYFFNGTVPAQIQQWVDPVSYHSRLKANLGVFAQDQWTMRRLTLNLGLRYDYVNAFNPPEETPAGMFAVARSFPAVYNVPNFKDLSPRLGAAYDLFGNGRTALKVQAAKYVRAETTSIAGLNHPAYRISINSTRIWNDTNGDYVPDCVLTNFLENGECGQLANLALGSTIRTTTFADDVISGFGNRGNNWQTSLTFQHELRPKLVLSGGYYRTWYNNLTLIDNRAITPADFEPYCVPAPTDTRLGAVSGQQVCGLFDITQAALFRVPDNLNTQASHYGDRTEVYNGLDVALSARFGEGGLVQGGVASGQTVNDNCQVIDSPQQRFCKVTLPFKGQTQYKASGIYPLPWWDILASAVFQNLPGVPYSANYPVPSAVVAQSLGRPLAAGGVAFVALVEPNTLYEDRLTQVDLRFAKIFRAGRARLRADFDLYNVLNARTILAVNSTYGTQWRRPSSVLGGRMWKLGGQFDF